MCKKDKAGQQDLSRVHTALESLSGKSGDPKHGSVPFRRTSMAHMALGHPNNAIEFAAVEKIPHCQRGVLASCGWAELCSLWGWQTLGDVIPCSATCMSRMSHVSNTLLDTTTANHTNPKINEKTVRACQPGNETILAHVATYRLCHNRVHVAFCNLLSGLQLQNILQKIASLAYQWSSYGPTAGSRILQLRSGAKESASG